MRMSGSADAARRFELESGIHIRQSRGAIFLRQLTWQWIACVQDYNFAHAKKRHADAYDVAYAHNERVNVSLLAAATWRVGGVAIQDYTGQRWGKKNAQVDLFAYGGTSNSAFIFEAKMAWPTKRTNDVSAWPSIDDSLTRATQDARSVLSGDEERFGVCFVVPRVAIPSGKWSATAKRRIRPFCRKVLDYCLQKENVAANAIAWIFPKYGGEYFDWEGSNARYFYPGVITLFRDAGRR